jgi:hypothetical protein
MANPFGAVGRSLREARGTIRGISGDIASGRVSRAAGALSLAESREKTRQSRGALELEGAKAEREVKQDEPISFNALIDEAGQKGLPSELVAGMKEFFNQPDPLAPEGSGAKLGDIMTTRAQARQQYTDMRKQATQTRAMMDRLDKEIKSREKIAGVKATAAAEKEEKKEKKEKRKTTSSLRKDAKRRERQLQKDLDKANIDIMKAEDELESESIIDARKAARQRIEEELKELRKTPRQIQPDIRLPRTGTRQRGITQAQRSGKDISELTKFDLGSSR